MLNFLAELVLEAFPAHFLYLVVLGSQKADGSVCTSQMFLVPFMIPHGTGNSMWPWPEHFDSMYGLS